MFLNITLKSIIALRSSSKNLKDKGHSFENINIDILDSGGQMKEEFERGAKVVIYVKEEKTSLNIGGGLQHHLPPPPPFTFDLMRQLQRLLFALCHR